MPFRRADSADGGALFDALVERGLPVEGVRGMHPVDRALVSGRELEAHLDAS